MYASEFLVVLIWLVSPPLVMGLSLLRLWHLRGAMPRTRRFWAAAALLVVLTALAAFLFVAAGPAWLGRYIGVRDVVIFGFGTMWAPFAFLAVGLALPVAGWWARRGDAQ